MKILFQAAIIFSGLESKAFFQRMWSIWAIILWALFIHVGLKISVVFDTKRKGSD